MKELEIFQVERPWGNFRQFTKNTPSTVKVITIKPLEQLSLQSHQKRSEFWRIISGNGTVEIGENKHDAKAGDEFNTSLGAKHRIIAGEAGIAVLEISTGEFDEEDIIRYEDKYGRS